MSLIKDRFTTNIYLHHKVCCHLAKLTTCHVTSDRMCQVRHLGKKYLGSLAHLFVTLIAFHIVKKYVKYTKKGTHFIVDVWDLNKTLNLERMLK